LGYAKILMEGAAGPLNSEQESMLSRMLISAESLLRMVDSVLETARLNSGMMTLRVKSATPTKIAENMVIAVYAQATRKNISISFSGPENRTPGIYDPDKIRMILINLLTNAVKYTMTGQIEVSATATKEGSEIIIADSGVGIPEDQLRCVFEEFIQLDHQGRKKEIGFGLGLSIVAKLVDAIDATLIVSSAVGVGTAFTLYLPTLPDPANQAETAK
jgi:signal transduction histidine kinase